MTLEELLPRIREPFTANPDWPVEFGVITQSASGEWKITNPLPIVSVRLGEDEILLELDESPSWLAVTSHKILAWLKLTNWLQSRQKPSITAGKLLEQFQSYLAEYSQRPVEIGATGDNSHSKKQLLLCVLRKETPNKGEL